MFTVYGALVGFTWWKASRGLAPDTPLLHGSAFGFRVFFLIQWLQYLRPAYLHFKPYAMCRGGATFDFLANGGILRTLHRGR